MCSVANRTCTSYKSNTIEFGKQNFAQRLQIVRIRKTCWGFGLQSRSKYSFTYGGKAVNSRAQRRMEVWVTKTCAFRSTRHHPQSKGSLSRKRMCSLEWRFFRQYYRVLRWRLLKKYYSVLDGLPLCGNSDNVTAQKENREQQKHRSQAANQGRTAVRRCGVDFMK